MEQATISPTARTNRMAIASLVLGILWLGGVGAVLALVFGKNAQRAIDESHGLETGRGMATAGIVLGVVGIVGAILYWGAIILIATHGNNTPPAY